MHQARWQLQPRVLRTAAQPVLAWLGVRDLDRMVSGKAGGITLGTLKASGIAGSVVMLQQAPDSVPDWLVKEFEEGPSAWTPVCRRLHRRASAQTLGEFPPAPGSRRGRGEGARGANGLAFDAEPYGYPDTEWDGHSPTDRLTMRTAAESLAPIIKGVGSLVIYPSSNASFPGSYNDVIRAQNGDIDTYAKNLFPDFLHGLLSEGVDVTLTDASFGFGPQRGEIRGPRASRSLSN